jgi:hypothetical protein
MPESDPQPAAVRAVIAAAAVSARHVTRSWSRF